MEQSETVEKLAQALVETQAALGLVPRSAANPFFHSRYSDLAAVCQASRPALAQHGLAIAQTFGDSGNGAVVVHTTLLHISGQWLRGSLPIRPVKADPQSLGSAITYARRYSWASMIGLVSEGEDDDAEAAMDRDGAGKARGPNRGRSRGVPGALSVESPPKPSPPKGGAEGAARTRGDEPAESASPKQRGLMWALVRRAGLQVEEEPGEEGQSRTLILLEGSLGKRLGIDAPRYVPAEVVLASKARTSKLISALKAELGEEDSDEPPSHGR